MFVLPFFFFWSAAIHHRFSSHFTQHGSKALGPPAEGLSTLAARLEPKEAAASLFLAMTHAMNPTWHSAT